MAMLTKENLVWRKTTPTVTSRTFSTLSVRIHREMKGGFVKGWLWRMYPRSGFRSVGTCECTLVPVFVPGEHPNVPSFRFSFRGNIRQNHPFGNHPFRFLRKVNQVSLLKIVLADPDSDGANLESFRGIVLAWRTDQKLKHMDLFCSAEPNLGVARGLLQGRPLQLFPWDGELARNWPRVDQLYLSNSVYKSLPWRFRAVFFLL